ncbi:hypothetical protein SEVIR_2G094800v4 [Setaria viridis]|uniref:glucan endo-1,3-beta-D-glucosidase n=1 Tax=Setaria viridis TaxID=4556 RepID=A0A4U6VRP6_SETVI|nr:glucan endo-1,3-beta-glucosidase-like isoform X1 [Setaria viridis]TKW31273.1 hypothetical protein SEVIR_2G094800v2 [Setaria viridis]
MAPPSWQGHAAAAVLSAFLLVIAPYAAAIGVNYGTKGDNLPPPAKVASFLANRTRIDRVKLFDTNADMVRAFAGTGIALTVTAANGDIPKLATKDGAAAWVSANVAPYYPATDISLVAVGNEIMATADKTLINSLVPAMRALKAALVAAGFPKIRVSTPHSLGVLSVSEPPSASRFRDGFDRAVFAPMLEFHRQTGSPFMVNPYPYFGYNGGTLAYALARPGAVGVADPGTGITYTSMFEAQLDAVFSAMKRLGFGDVEIAVGETGWPSKAEDGQAGVSAAEAAEYNRYLIGEAAGGSGTPLMPKRTFETYIFSLFNENLKPGPVAERNFGLFEADLTPVYDAGLMKDGAKAAAEPAPAATLTSAGSGAPEPAKARNGGKAAKKHVTEAAAPAETDASAPAETPASAPAPSSSGDAASPMATGPSPSGAAPAEGDSTDDEKTPEEEGGDAPAAAAGESSEAAPKDGDAAEGSTEKKADTSPAPAGAASAAADILVPISSILTAALSLALHI